MTTDATALRAAAAKDGEIQPAESRDKFVIGDLLTRCHRLSERAELAERLRGHQLRMIDRAVKALGECAMPGADAASIAMAALQELAPEEAKAVALKITMLADAERATK